MKKADSNSDSVANFETPLDTVDCRSPELLARKTIFVASSRLPRKLDTIPELFDALLKLATQLDPAKDALITTEGTTCDRLVRRIGELFRIPVVVLQGTASKTEFRRLAETIKESTNEIAILTNEQVGADDLLAWFASRMVVLSVRPKGNLHRAVLARLSAGKKTRMLVSDQLTKSSLVEELLGEGATGWYLFGKAGTDQQSPSQNTNVVSVDAFQSDDFLLHWTRRRAGPWPEQPVSEYLDELIFRQPEQQRSELAVLRRILATSTILASNDLTRSPRRVVCFSDLSLKQLQQRRVFRPHLSRWDFEPYGVAIRKSWLEQQGARSAIYGDEAIWDSLAECDRPFFQLNQKESSVDWSLEEEWRIIGDVDLRNVPADQAVVFVPTIDAANQVAEFSRWPVVVLGQS